MDRISVLVVDDHAVTRDGIKYVLQSSPHFQVVAEASSGVEALEQVRARRPSVVLMDVKLPEMDGLEATRRIKEQFPEVRVIMLTGFDELRFVVDALLAGATGYILKTARQDEICQAVELAAAGLVAIKASLLHQALEVIRGTGAAEQDGLTGLTPDRRGELLTERENAVLRLLVQGKGNKEIAVELCIATGTAKNHVQRIMAKLGASDRTDAAVMAVRKGLVE